MKFLGTGSYGQIYSGDSPESPDNPRSNLLSAGILHPSSWIEAPDGPRTFPDFEDARVQKGFEVAYTLRFGRSDAEDTGARTTFRLIVE